MKLNPDIVRGILLTVEEKCDFSTPWNYCEFSCDSEYLVEYTHEEIIYHIHQCELSCLLTDVTYYDGGTSAYISDLSPSGHQFLADIRSDNIWNGVKSIAGKIGSTSLDAITQIASNVITELIKAQFGLTAP